MPSIGELFGAAASNDAGRQLFIWGVLYGLLSSVFEPITTDVTQDMWGNAVGDGLKRVLSPDELANMVVRGWRGQSAAEGDAAKSGVSQADFDTMVNNRRNPISPEEAAVALRRQIIPEAGAPGIPAFENAIAEGNLGNQWGPVIQALAKQIPSPADILQAFLEGQIPDEATARALYEAVGGLAQDPANNVDWFQLMFDTRGQAPTPTQALELLNRGIIPEMGVGPDSVSYQQAFLEGPWRNKWLQPFLALRFYLPPPRTVTAMLKQGALTEAQAADLLAKQGLTPDLVNAYIQGATVSKTATAKKLSESNIITLLNDKLIDVPTAVQFLEQLGYPANEATALASTAQAAKTIADLKTNVNRVETLYLNHKIDKANALTLLANLGLAGDQAAAKVADWDLLKQSTVKTLTVAQITSAWEYQVYTQAQAQTELENLGYTPFDAWTLLSIKAKQALPNPPPFGPGLVA